jgi:drug/metabolite transporter (DMT)-like permease
MPNQLISVNVIYLWMVLFAVVWLLPSILLTYFSVEILDPGRINILLAFEVAVGFISASLLTNEIIGPREYLGALFVVSACFVDVLIKSKIKY